MTDEEALKRFQAERQRLLDKRTGPSTSGAGQAFVGEDMSREGDLPDLSKSSGPSLSGVLGTGADISAGMIGESKAAQLVDALPIPPQYKLAADIGARVLGGGAAVFPTHLAWSRLRQAIGDKSAPDNFEKHVSDAWDAALGQANAGAYGAGASRLEGALHPSAYVDPTRLDNMKSIKDSLKKTYEDIGGKQLVEDMRGRWNPMRILKPLETELDDQSVVQRLKDKGLDPQMARRVALTGGQTTADLLDNTLYSTLQKATEASPGGSKYLMKYKGTRAKMFQMMVDDLANTYGDHLPEEQIGKAISKAVDGNFNVPNSIMTNSLNEIRNNLQQGTGFDVTKMQAGANMAGLSKDGPARLIHEIPATPNGKTSFDNIQQVRSYLSTIIHAQDQDPQVVADAKKVAKTIDKSMSRQLPDSLKSSYMDAVTADDQLNEGQFNTKFVKSLLGRQGGYRAYGQKLLESGDVGNFLKLEKAVGPDEANKVRRGISEILTENAANSTDGTLAPQNLDKMLNEHGDYGKYFIQSVMGKDYVRNIERYKGAMENINEAAHNNPLVNFGTNALRYGPTAKILYDWYNGHLDYKDAALAALTFTVPKYSAKILTNPEATKTIEKMSTLIKAGKNPGTISRLAVRALEAAGISPEDALKEQNFDPKGKDMDSIDINNLAMPGIVM